MQILRPCLGVVLLALVAGNHVAAQSNRSDAEHKLIKRSPKTVVHHHYHHSPAPAPAPAPASGGGGMFGGGAVKNIAAGTVLAGTGAFAGTIGATEAKRLLGSDDHDRDNNDGNKHQAREKDDQQNTQPQPQPQPQGQPQGQQVQPQAQTQQVPANVAAGQTNRHAYPVAILMSDGSYEPLPSQLAAQSANTADARATAGQQDRSPLYDVDTSPPQPRYQAADAQPQYPNYAAPGAGAGAGWGAGAGAGAAPSADTGGFVFPPSN